MISAMEFSHSLVDGFEAGIRNLAQQREERAATSALADQASSQMWSVHAQRLERQLDDLRLRLAQQVQENGQLRQQLRSTQQLFVRRGAQLSGHIRDLDDQLQRSAANEYAYEQLRARLVDLLHRAVPGVTDDLLTDQGQVDALKQAWNHFMQHHDVRRGVPSATSLMRG